MILALLWTFMIVFNYYFYLPVVKEMIESKELKPRVGKSALALISILGPISIAILLLATVFSLFRK